MQRIFSVAAVCLLLVSLASAGPQFEKLGVPSHVPGSPIKVCIQNADGKWMAWGP